ncbi:cysteine peptidase family C39 domain-containing protein [Kordiimonas sp. SCSIO 12603]|uniref:cysteine peptidase family C39 domain-containing protein n=1 Tax=Kordiimonas sp. SCSIO 12603 TaxID=2829596 RepID=UPI00351CF947
MHQTLILITLVAVARVSITCSRKLRLPLNLSNKSRLPIIRQNEAAECGLVSFAMVVGYYGFATDLTSRHTTPQICGNY